METAAYTFARLLDRAFVPLVLLAVAVGLACFVRPAMPRSLYRNHPGYQLNGLFAGVAAASGFPVMLLRVLGVVLFICAPLPSFIGYMSLSLCLPWEQPTPAAAVG